VSDPNFTAAYFDQTGLYAFGRQPEAVSWALAQLGGALSLVRAASALEAELARFVPAYQRGLRTSIFARLHLAHGDLDADMAFLQALFDWLTASRAGWDQFFHDWFAGSASAERAAGSSQGALYTDAAFQPVREGLEARTQSDAHAALQHPYWSRTAPVSLVIDEVEAVWAPIAEQDDWSAFEAKLADIAALNAALGVPCHRTVTDDR
jgi:uncharacterized protein YdiU (UPF0061 family)